LGDLLAIRRSKLGFLQQYAKRGDVASFHLGRARMFLVNHREGVHHVLVAAHGKYRKGIGLRHASRLLGRGLLTSEGELWRAERRLIQPFFTRQRAESHLHAITSEVDSMLTRWSIAARPSMEVDLGEEMQALALRMLARSLLGPVVDHEAPKIGPALAIALEHAMTRMQAIFNFTEWLPTRANRNAAEAIATLDAVIERVLATSGESGLVSTLVAELGVRDRQLLRDELITLLVAGHETTACVLSWALYLLSRYPLVQELARREVAEVLGGERTGAITGRQLQGIPYCRAVIMEAMRLYPPVWLIPREAIEPDQILGTAIRPGDGVLVSPYTLHRDPMSWDDPDRFRPERFLEDADHAGSDSSYLPFGAGPRKCIGHHLGMLEATTTLASLLRQFELRASGPDVGVTATLTLKFARVARVIVTRMNGDN
jgi:cytochrome P450